MRTSLFRPNESKEDLDRGNNRYGSDKKENEEKVYPLGTPEWFKEKKKQNSRFRITLDDGATFVVDATSEEDAEAKAKRTISFGDTKIESVALANSKYEYGSWKHEDEDWKEYEEDVDNLGSKVRRGNIAWESNAFHTEINKIASRYGKNPVVVYKEVREAAGK